MPINFPVSNDVFNVPSVPASTALGSAGDGTRTHSQHHQDLGDAIDAMQLQQTLLAHTHDGVTVRHGAKLSQANTHQSVDTDSGPTSIHHTIGSGANQYSSGAHTHPVVATYPVGAFFFAVVPTDPATLGVIGTWTSVGQRFLCASGGGLGLTAGATGGSNSHSHTIDASTNSQSSHTHNYSSTVTGGSSINWNGHGHGGGLVNANGIDHYHQLFSAGLGTASTSAGSTSFVDYNHSHYSANDSGWHDHTPSVISGTGDHTHNISPGSTGSTGSHSHTNSTPSTTNNLVPLFVVYMWKRVS